jgi:hypothetical protein
VDLLGLARISSALVLSVLLAACTGAEGDPCQEPDDCNDGLMCCKPSPTAGARGLCQSVCMEFVRDAGPLPDAGDAGGADAAADDAGPDSGSEDAGPVDAGPADAGPADAGPADAGPADAGPVDAGVDAG